MSDDVRATYAAAIRATSARRVARVVGASREAVLAYGGGFVVSPLTRFALEARVDRIRQLLADTTRATP
ncbi:MAG TPA: hypothetical protein VGL81_09055 [Polyangiaceae bacterium]|jgi:hypothetical protein